jgi:nicotinate-nucleotide adenylyltransferase
LLKSDLVQVAFFGGSFDPPHLGHVAAVEHVLRSGQVGHVLCAPVHEHALAKSLSAFEHRLAMTGLALQHLSEVTISEIERELPAPNYTLYTLQALQRRNPSWQLRLMVGSDVIAEQQKWRFFEEIVALAPPLILPRAGTAGGEGSVLPEVSSSQVRALLHSEPVTSQRLTALVPRRVLDYIATHGLYR